MPGCITGGDDDVGNGIATLIKSRRSIRAFTLQAVPEYILGSWSKQVLGHRQAAMFRLGVLSL